MRQDFIKTTHTTSDRCLRYGFDKTKGIIHIVKSKSPPHNDPTFFSDFMLVAHGSFKAVDETGCEVKIEAYKIEDKLIALSVHDAVMQSTMLENLSKTSVDRCMYTLWNIISALDVIVDFLNHE